jgi:hypothetical protein
VVHHHSTSKQALVRTFATCVNTNDSRCTVPLKEISKSLYAYVHNASQSEVQRQNTMMRILTRRLTAARNPAFFISNTDKKYFPRGLGSPTNQKTVKNLKCLDYGAKNKIFLYYFLYSLEPRVHLATITN